MKLYPQDLGGKNARTVLAHRVRPSGRFQASRRFQADETASVTIIAAEAPLGFWGRLWAGKMRRRIGAEESRTVLLAVRNPARFWTGTALLALPAALGALNQALGYGWFGVALTEATAAGTWLWVFGSALPSALFRRKHAQMFERPLSSQEIAALLPAAHDELERTYLILMLDVTRQEIAPAPGVDLRAALHALGDAIERLPATRAVGGENSDIMTEVLRRTAQETLRAAQGEPDRVVAASLMRQVEALHRRADATGRANLLVRRFGALRLEMAAETEALRAGLAAYYTGSHDVADLSRLAEDVQRVAAEAAVMTAAVEEVDGWSAGGPSQSPSSSTPISSPPAEGVPPRLQLGQ